MTNASGTIRGRKRIAHKAGRSPRTIDRWVSRGILAVAKDGPFENSALIVRAADVSALTGKSCGDDENE